MMTFDAESTGVSREPKESRRSDPALVKEPWYGFDPRLPRSLVLRVYKTASMTPSGRQRQQWSKRRTAASRRAVSICQMPGRPVGATGCDRRSGHPVFLPACHAAKTFSVDMSPWVIPDDDRGDGLGCDPELRP